GWQNVMQRAWARLFICLYEPDAQRYPVSVLTATALMKGIVRILMEEYRHRGSFSSVEVEETEETLDPIPAVHIKMTLLNRAREEAEGVFCDIQALIGVTDADLLACRAWMSRLRQRV
ncbi:hypothetical protein CPB84DRAFT_1797567, partial [Gymnopilus junonius]